MRSVGMAGREHLPTGFQPGWSVTAWRLPGARTPAGLLSALGMAARSSATPMAVVTEKAVTAGGMGNAEFWDGAETEPEAASFPGAQEATGAEVPQGGPAARGEFGGPLTLAVAETEGGGTKALRVP